MSLPAHPSAHFTWDHYRTWPDDERWEIIAGEAYAMSPAPTVAHQFILLELVFQFRQHLAGKPCRPLMAPCDLKLSDEDVVQPDLLVVCDDRQIHRTHIEGPPRLVVEILSPGSLAHDRMRKLRLYARAGVAECWLITPAPALIEVFQLDGATYRVAGTYAPTGQPQHLSPSFPDLALQLDPLFAFPPAADDDPALHDAPAPYPARPPPPWPGKKLPR